MIDNYYVCDHCSMVYNIDEGESDLFCSEYCRHEDEIDHESAKIDAVYDFYRDNPYLQRQEEW